MGADEVAAELYTAAPDEFVARRDAHVRALRADGDRQLATEVGRWRKPLVAAWVVNLLAWQRREQIGKLIELGAELVAAQRSSDGEALRGLTARKQRLVHALAMQGQELAADAGHPVGTAASYEVEATLNAAVADPEIGRRVLAGRLLRPESYAGFGPLPDGDDRPVLWVVGEPPAGGDGAGGRRAGVGAGGGARAAAKRPGRAGAERAGRAGERPAEEDRSAERRAEERRAAERERAEQAVAEAQDALAEAERRHTAALGEVDAAEEAWRDLGERADELRAQLADNERRRAEAALDKRRLGHAADRTAAEVKRARTRADSAERRLARHRA